MKTRLTNIEDILLYFPSVYDGIVGVLIKQEKNK